MFCVGMLFNGKLRCIGIMKFMEKLLACVGFKGE